MKVRKIRIENGTHSIVVKNPVLKSDKRLKTLKVVDGIELILPGKCIAFGNVMRVNNVRVY